MASFGSALTGQDDGTDTPLRNIIDTSRNVASQTDTALFGDPRSRAALLQIGLNLMQPTGIGQTGLGHFGQAIGAGGESVSRAEAEDLARQKQESEEEYKTRMAGAKEREVGAYEKGQSLRAVDQRLEAERLRQQGRMALQGVKDYTASAKAIFEHVNGITANEDDPLVKQYKGKTPDQIADMLKAQGPTASPPAPVPGGGVLTRDQGGNRFTSSDGGKTWVYSGPSQ